MIATKYIIIGTTVISLALSSVTTYKICEYVYNNRIEAVKKAAAKEKEDAIAAERKTCKDNQAQTKRNGDELQEKYTSIVNRFNALNNKLRDIGAEGASVPITGIGQRNDGRTAGDVLPVLGRIQATELIGKLKQADDQTAQLIQCQSHVRYLESLSN